MLEVTPQFLAIIPMLIALNQGLKMLGMPSRFAILTNWVGGIALGVLIGGGLPVNDALVGFIIGSMASGIYDAKAFLPAKEDTVGERG